MDLPDRQRRADIPIFEAGHWTCTVADVFAWRSLVGAAGCGQSSPSPGQDADALIEAFRYRRELISAEECEAWLAQRGLGYADLEASMDRRASGATPLDADQALVDGLLDDAFDEHVRELARHVAWALDSGVATTGERPDVLAFASWQAELSARKKELTGAESRRREAGLLARAWTRLTGLMVEFDELSVAREAWSCVEHEGESLELLASQHGLAWRRFDRRPHELTPAQRALLEALPPGGLAIEHGVDGPVCLWQLEARQVPTLQDAEFAAAVERSLVRRLLDDAVARQIRWHWPLHHAV